MLSASHESPLGQPAADLVVRHMKKVRAAIPKQTKDRLLAEFNHCCAICAAARPQVHHIDEDSSNNEITNLLPLCPNHHLSDQHNPTRKIDPSLLSLFRIHRDPLILCPQFLPLFNRAQFLIKSNPSYTFDEIRDLVIDLARFVREMNMGNYYADSLIQLLDIDKLIPISFIADKVEDDATENARKDCVAHVARSSPKAIHLITELLRYQTWPKFEAKH